MLGKGFFLAKSHNPDLPPEEWTLVYEKYTPGSYNVNLGWGKYKFEICGGGGSGAAATCVYDLPELFIGGVLLHKIIVTNGSPGYIKTGSFNVFFQENSIISGDIGGGGSGGYSASTGQTHTETVGTAGTGATSGAAGSSKWDSKNIDDKQARTGYAMVSGVSGSGGGSSSLRKNGILIENAPGGKGGDVIEDFITIKLDGSALENSVTARISSIAGGIGGGSGTGVAAENGGASAQDYHSGSARATGNSGGSGYIRIYKSNLKPELV